MTYDYTKPVYEDDGWEPVSDYDDQMDGLRLGLLSYDDTHCVHGTFTGSWAGPDYMCHWCESGITDEEYAHMRAREELHFSRTRALEPRLIEILAQVNASAPGPEQDRLAARMMHLLHMGVRYRG